MKAVRLLIFLAVLFSFGLVAAVSTETIAIGPYVQNVTGTSAKVIWWTESGQQAPVCFRDPLSKYTKHELLLTDLESNTEYYYDVLDDGSPESVGTVTTFPDTPAPFRFAVISDTQSDQEVHAALIDMIIDEDPLLLLGAGDAVSEGLSLSDWETFFDVRRELQRHVPFYGVLGNHEHDSRLYFDFFDLPGNERYYSFAVGDVLFVMLDSEGLVPFDLPLEEKTDPTFLFYFAQQKAWLKHTLETNADKSFIFAAFHKPLYSVNPDRQVTTLSNRLRWGDVFERYGVQVVFSGHDHHYHHAYTNGTHYVVCGGGGGHLYENTAIQPETVLTEKVHHYITVDVEEDTATLTATDIDGAVIESFTVEARH